MLPHSNSIVPVLLWRPKAGHPVHVGSAVLLCIEGRSVLLTTAHVTDLRHEGKLCVPGPRGATEFAGSIGANLIPPGSLRDQDPIDIGYLVPSIDSRYALPSDYVPIEPESVDLAGHTNAGEFCLVAGFPLSRKWAKHRDGEITGARLSFVGIGFTDPAYVAHGYDFHKNILVEYHLDKAIYPEGDRANAPSPRGMSGGGVFRVGRDTKGNPDTTNAVLVGIMHKFDERKHMFVATKIREALKLFVRSPPDEIGRRVATSQVTPSSS